MKLSVIKGFPLQEREACQRSPAASVEKSVDRRRTDFGQRAIEIAQKRLSEDEWPEYYDGTNGRLIGKEARKYQTWTIAGFLLAKELLEEPEYLGLVSFDREHKTGNSFVLKVMPN